MRAAIYLTLFVGLVVAGILVKRLAGHPEFMMLFHLPAAVFLVLGGLEVRKHRQRDYEREIEAVRQRLGDTPKSTVGQAADPAAGPPKNTTAPRPHPSGPTGSS